MAETEKVTEAQAEEALRALVDLKNQQGDEPEEAAAPAVTEITDAAPAADEPAVEATAPAESDDVASLKQRLEVADTERQKERERYEARWKAIQERNAANERILRDRYIRKSTAVDRALKTLRATRTTDGVSETEVDRVIAEMEQTMNPQSASYVSPEPAAAAREDQAIVLNAFLNEKGMDMNESEEFGKWMRSEAPNVLTTSEQDVARESLNGFLQIAHGRWQQGMRDKEKETRRSDAVEAVRTVQRTQREAAKAASGASAAPRKQSIAPKSDQADWRKMSEDERHDWVSALLKQSVEQYR